MNKKLCSFHFVAILVALSTLIHAQSTTDPAPAAAAGIQPEPQQTSLPVSFRGDAAVFSKYVWRGQRLTNDWSLQPSATVGAGPFAFNVWGTLDLAACNEGDALFLTGNPAAPPGDHNGMQGKFSEVDYTFSYSGQARKTHWTAGAILYTFPERSATLNATTELYAGVTLDAPLAPSATLYVDVDETGADGGTTGLYLKLGASHSFPVGHRVIPSVDLSGWLGVANSGFGSYYYGASEAGPHDVNLTVAVPFRISERWSASPCIAYTGLLGDFRGLQYPDLRDVYRGLTGPGGADTVWGGGTLSLAF
jgi:hypothetical protein